jgi:hypothetical protein
MYLKKPNNTVSKDGASNDAIQPPAKFLRRQNKPDFSLFLIRLILLAITAVLLFSSVPPGELSLQWRLIIFFAALIVAFSFRIAKE